jgi:AcrR family transcriptional regulator
MHTDGTHVKSRRRAQGDATRVALVDAARELFGDQGYAATSTEEIVARAGVTKGALYHHFADKEALFRTVFEQVEREVSDVAVQAFLLGAAWDALVQGCRLWIDAHLDPAVRRISLTDARAVLGPDVVRSIETRLSTVALRGALRRGMHAGVLRRQSLRPLSLMLAGALREACWYVADADDVEAARAEVQTIVVALLLGTRADVRPAGDQEHG